MSDHKLSIDVQKIALALQEIRSQVDVVEDIIKEALLKENENE